MAAPAFTSTTDVESRLGREFDEQEAGLAFVLLGDAENMIRARVPSGNLADVDEDALVQVAANAVVRVLRNPDGYRSETAGGVSYTIDTRVAAGFLTILADEWSLLGLNSTQAGSFAPYLQVPAPGVYGWAGPWWH